MTDTDIEHIPEKELGVELDEAVDSAIQSRSVAYALGDIHARLDSAADHRHIPHDLRTRLREVQSKVAGLQEDAGHAEQRYQDRAEAIRERLEE